MIDPNNIDKLTFWRIGHNLSIQDEKNPIILYLWGIYPKCFENINNFILKIKTIDKNAIQTIIDLINNGTIEFSKNINWDEYK